MARSEEPVAGAPLAGAPPSQAWLATILEATPDAIVVVNGDGVIVTVNVQAERLFGYARDELVGLPVEMLLPARLRAAHAGYRRNFAADPRTRPMGVGLELTALHRDGHEIHVEINLSPLPTADGPYVVTAIRDVSERRRAEQDRARLAAMVNSTSDAILSTTPDGIITSWNPVAARLFGYSAAEAIGRSVTMLAPDRADEILQNLGRLRRGQAFENFETVRVSQDGRAIDVALTGSPVRDDSCAIAGTTTIFRDIGARKQAEAALRESQECFRGAFDAAAIGICIVGLDGSFLQVNRSLCEIVGYSEDELLQLTFQVITHPDDVEADLLLVQQLLAGTIPNYHMEKRYFRKDGSVVWVLLSVSLVRDDAGTPLYFVSQILDITRQRRAERLKDEFVSTVSHELRTPLTSISGYVDLLLDGAAGELAETSRQFLGIVQQNSRRLIELVNDLLDISRIEAGQVGLRREPVDLAAQLRDVIAGFAPQITAKQQLLRLEPLATLPLIWADSQRSAQIFTNLVSNAHKYTPRGGTIAVAGSIENDAVRIDVIDTGIGISEEEQAAPAVLSSPPIAEHKSQRIAGHILVIEDDPDVGSLLREFLEQEGYEVSVVATAEEAVASVGARPPDLITLDLRLPDADGWSVIERLRATGNPVPPVVVVSILPENGYGRPLGVVDYLAKPMRGPILRERVTRALATTRDKERNV